MADSYFNKERVKRFMEMKRAGDQAGINRMLFGEALYVLRHRISSDFSQERAAELATLTRVQWNRIENGHVRPLPETVCRIADVLEIAPAILLKLNGDEVPEEYALYDKKYAHKKMDEAVEQSTSRSQFFMRMEPVWEEFQWQMMSTLPERISIRPAYAELLSKILEHLSAAERIQLALDLVEHSSDKEGEPVFVDTVGFYEMVNTRLEECRYGGWKNEEFII